MRVIIVPEGFPGTREMSAVASIAARNISLHPEVASLELVFDAPEFQGSGFWTILRATDGIEATLYGSPLDVLTPRKVGDDPGIDLDLQRVVLEADSRLDRLQFDRWIHRNLLQLDDLVRGRVRPQEIPSNRSEGLQAVWDVWTDGRLRNWQHPGLSQAERRSVFYRTFAAHGMLLPRHWETFHRLWKGDFGEQTGLLRSLEQLPRT